MVRFGKRAGVVAAAAALVLSAGLHPLSAAVPAPVAAAVPAAVADLPTGSVTLVTGDRVTVGRGPDGAPNVSVEQVRRADGREPGYRTEQTDGRLHVLPADALPYLNAGVLDRALFDIGRLIETGAGAELPLLVRSAGGSLPGATAHRALESLGAAAVRVPAGQAGDFWAALAVPGVAPGQGLRGAARLGRGVTGVWLDRKLSATLDQSVPLVGAPQAWAAGYDGSGVKVAVLDTGVDPTHPDLAGKVLAARDFTGSASGTVDRHGHGTHVASTVAGLGTASAGRYKGVAPGSTLLVGKVLGDNGSGALSGIIDGMEWAAAQGARVISMSLGGTAGDENDDPVVQAVQRLTASTGALFVIAAGNSGPAAGTVGTPGIAADALTVANTTKTDQLAPTSSRGPLPYDRVAKPDLAAPGTAIAAARAAGTALGPIVDQDYTRITGTSMATPHVAGAAAILAQQHPDWSGRRIKSTLMSTGTDAGLTVFEQGAGRLDVARAVAQRVGSSTGGLDFGRVQDGSDGDLTEQVTYTNDGGEPVTLRLATSLRTTGGADHGGTLGAPAELTVPAGGTATAAVTLKPAGLAQASYTGVVVATADGVVLRTPVALVRGPKLYPVRVEVRYPRQPATVDPTITAFDARTGASVRGSLSELRDDPWRAYGTIMLPAGRWQLGSFSIWHDQRTGIQNWVDLVAPEAEITGPAEVVLDGNLARAADVTTDRPSEAVGQSTGLTRVSENGAVTRRGMHARYGTVLWLLPSAPVRSGQVITNVESSRVAPQLSITVEGRSRLALHPRYYWAYRTEPGFAAGRRIRLVDLGPRIEPSELPGLRGAIALLDLSWTGGYAECSLPKATIEQLKAAGAVGVLQTSSECAGKHPFPWYDAAPSVLPVASLPTDDAEALRKVTTAGPVTLTVTSTPVTPYLYHLAVVNEQRIPAQPAVRVRDRELARIPSTYRAAGPGLAQHFIGATKQVNLHQIGVARNLVTHVPTVREELVGPIRPGVLWNRSMQLGFGAGVLARTARVTKLRAGRMPAEEWGSAPRGVGPAAVPRGTAGFAPHAWCFACRDGDTLYVAPMYNDPDPAVIAGDPAQNLGPASIDGPAGTTSLWRGEEQLPVKLYSGRFPSFTLPAGAARYRLSTDWAKPGAGRVRTDWTFSSARPDGPGLTGQRCLTSWLEPARGNPCAVQGLLHLRYRTPVDLANRAARGPAVLQLTPYYEPSPSAPAVRLRSIAVSVSTDDGATWRRVPAIRAGDRYLAVFGTPRSGPADQAVSVRVDAVDAGGNTISQRLDRAWTLRPGR